MQVDRALWNRVPRFEKLLRIIAAAIPVPANHSVKEDFRALCAVRDFPKRFHFFSSSSVSGFSSSSLGACAACCFPLMFAMSLGSTPYSAASSLM